MFTTVLAYVIAVAGLVMIGTGAWGVLVLMDARSWRQIPRRYYAITIAMICTGIGLLGITQALRLLLLIFAKA